MSTDPAMVAAEKIWSIVFQFGGFSTLMGTDIAQIIRHAYAEMLAAKNSEIAGLIRDAAGIAAERDRLAALLEQSNRDWSDTDTDIRETARRVLGEYVDGDSTCLPPVEEIVERLVEQVNRLQGVVRNMSAGEQENAYRVEQCSLQLARDAARIAELEQHVEELRRLLSGARWLRLVTTQE